MANESPSLAPAEVYAAPQRRRGSRIPTLIWLALLVAAAVGGFLANGHQTQTIDFGELGGKTVLTEEQLDSVVATYIVDGETYQVTAREAIAQESSLEALRNSDGTYVMPSAESVLSAVRTAILLREVEARGIEVSDEEYVGYVVDTFGTNDAEELARAYNMDVETVRARLRESAAIAKLRSEVVTPPESEPSQPTSPKKGKESERTKDYADYIIGLAGDEWDVEQDAWASFEGPYASALREYDVRNESASYDAAQTAYNVAYQLYSASVTSSATQWTDFVNGRLCEVNLALSSIVS